MFATEIFGPFLVRKLKWGDHAPGPPSGYATIKPALFSTKDHLIGHKIRLETGKLKAFKKFIFRLHKCLCKFRYIS